MKTRFIILTALLLLLISKVAYAEDSISIETVCDGRNVSVSGSLPNTSRSEMVTFMLGNWDNIIYVDQQNTTESGEFAFTYTMSESQSPGVYDIAVGSNINIPTYYGKLYYGLTQSSIFAADLDVTLSSYVPTISGTVSCSEGKTANFTVLNLTDNNVVCSEEITSDTGIFNLSYTLPSIRSGKRYEVVISCKENDVTIAEISANINTSLLFVTVNAEVMVEENVEIDTNIRTLNSNLINTQSTIQNNEAVSVVFPNLLPNTAFKIIANGREWVPRQEQVPGTDDYLYKVIKSIDISDDDYVPYFIEAQSAQNIKDKIIVVEYPWDKLRLTDACLFTSEKELQPTYIEHLGINITSVANGRIEFVVSDERFNSNNIKIIISGIMFKATSNGTAEIICTIFDVGEDN